jgi:hypothetical protein
MELMELMELAAVVPGGGTKALCNRASCSTTATPRRSTKGSSTATRKSKMPEPWPPAEYALPDTIEEIERGRRTPQRQRSLLDQDTLEERLERLAGGMAPRRLS